MISYHDIAMDIVINYLRAVVNIDIPRPTSGLPYFS